jgi:hypothetical protein
MVGQRWRWRFHRAKETLLEGFGVLRMFLHLVQGRHSQPVSPAGTVRVVDDELPKDLVGEDVIRRGYAILLTVGASVSRGIQKLLAHTCNQSIRLIEVN